MYSFLLKIKKWVRFSAFTVAIRGLPSIRHNSPQLPPPSSLAISTLPLSRRSVGFIFGPSVKRPKMSDSSNLSETLNAFIF